MSYPPGARDDSRAPYNSSGRQCPACNGTGEIPPKNSGSLCDKFPHVCLECDGTGFIDDEIPEQEFEPDDYYDQFDHE